MSKRGVSKISGNSSPKVGEATTYSITEWYPATSSAQRNAAGVTWELFKKRTNGSFTTTNIKKIGSGTFTFGEVAQRNTYRLEAYLYGPEGSGPTCIEINPQPVAIPRINKVELQYVDDSPGTVFSYTEKMRARAQCVNLSGQKLKFSLWEDDAAGDGHNANNLLIETKEATVNSSGVAVAEFMLTRALMQKAMQGETDPKQLEFYVTVEYFSNKKHATDNVNVNNPLSVPTTRPQQSSNNNQPAQPSSNNVSPRAQDSPAAEKPQSQKEEKGIVDTVTDWWNNLELWDWGESSGTIEPTQPPTQQPAGGRTVSIVQDSTVEDLLDAYFAKKEYTRQTGEAAGTFEYKIGSNGNKTSTDAEKENIAKIILAKPAVKALAAKKEYTTLEAIKHALTKEVYNKDEKVTFQIFKLGAEFKKINSAPLEAKVYLVARTSGLNGKQATVIIKEKDGLIKGSAGAVLPVLEITEAQMEQASASGDEVQGTEKTEFTAKIENGIAKIPVHLRPKSDDELKQWKEKLDKGKKDGDYNYTFAGATTIADENGKKSIAKAIYANAKEGKRGNPKIENGKTTYLEDIEKVLEIKTYNPGDKITFSLYKKETELLYLQAKAQGEKQHDKEFLKADGAYFTIGKKCECEERIRAFLRTLRVGEGTGEIIKAKDKVTKETIYVPHDFEKGYTTGFGGNLITDLSDHPRINYGGSTAAGAYQVMKDTWDDAQYSAKKTQYNIDSFSKENQDKFSVLLMKHHPGCSDLLSILLSGQTENSIRGRGSRIWASLPEKGDNSRYLFKGEPQPVTPMKTVLEHFDEFFKEELAGNSPLHLEKGFLKTFDIPCNCGGDSTNNSTWHHPVDNPQLRGWYAVWAPERSIHSSDIPGRSKGKHDGLDLYAPTGTQIYACVDGEVNEIYTSGSYGECINLKGEYNGTTYYFFYAHLSSVDIVAKDSSGNPTKVKAGDPIGKSGKTGSSATALNANQVHLHFELRTTSARTGGRIDPLSNISELDAGVNKTPNQENQP